MSQDGPGKSVRSTPTTPVSLWRTQQTSGAVKDPAAPTGPENGHGQRGGVEGGQPPERGRGPQGRGGEHQPHPGPGPGPPVRAAGRTATNPHSSSAEAAKVAASASAVSESKNPWRLLFEPCPTLRTLTPAATGELARLAAPPAAEFFPALVLTFPGLECFAVGPGRHRAAGPGRGGRLGAARGPRAGGRPLRRLPLRPAGGRGAGCGAAPGRAAALPGRRPGEPHAARRRLRRLPSPACRGTPARASPGSAAGWPSRGWRCAG